jgi:hypothetical protein
MHHPATKPGAQPLIPSVATKKPGAARPALSSIILQNRLLLR